MTEQTSRPAGIGYFRTLPFHRKILGSGHAAVAVPVYPTYGPVKITSESVVQMRSRPLLLTTVAFGLFGPLLGLLALCAEAIPGAHLARTDLVDIEIAGIMSAWAYVLAIFPASVAGLVWGAVFLHINAVRPVSPYIRTLMGAAIGGLAGFVGGLVMDALSDTGIEKHQFHGVFAASGAFAAAALAALFPIRSWLSTNSRRRSEQP